MTYGMVFDCQATPVKRSVSGGLVRGAVSLSANGSGARHTPARVL